MSHPMLSYIEEVNVLNGLNHVVSTHWFPAVRRVLIVRLPLPPPPPSSTVGRLKVHPLWQYLTIFLQRQRAGGGHFPQWIPHFANSPPHTGTFSPIDRLQGAKRLPHCFFLMSEKYKQTKQT